MSINSRFERVARANAILSACCLSLCSSTELSASLLSLPFSNSLPVLVSRLCLPVCMILLLFRSAHFYPDLPSFSFTLSYNGIRRLSFLFQAFFPALFVFARTKKRNKVNRAKLKNILSSYIFSFNSLKAFPFFKSLARRMAANCHIRENNFDCNMTIAEINLHGGNRRNIRKQC